MSSVCASNVYNYTMIGNGTFITSTYARFIAAQDDCDLPISIGVIGNLIYQILLIDTEPFDIRYRECSSIQRVAI